MKANIISTSLSILLLTPSLLQAKEFSFQSNEDKAQLVELYTSQGCSSCPPAEKKISNLVDNKDLWKKIVPIAFHVDYWDYLGWQDIYSSSKSTKRQQKHLSNANVYSLYTPQFVVNGKEWRGFFKGNNIPDSTNQRSGKLTLDWSTKSNTLSMQFENQSKQQPASCHFSLLSFEEAVKIGSGENKNLVLKQDFSSLSLVQADIEVRNHQYYCQISNSDFNKHYLSPSKGQKFALVGWVSNSNETHIQATGGWL